MSDLVKFNQTITLAKTQDYLQSVLGEKKASFVNNLTALVANDVNLQQCEPVTLMYAGIAATSLDLPLNKGLGLAYVIPFKNGKKGIVEAQFQIGYKGLLQLAIRSGQFSTINVTDVRDGEVENYDLLTGEISIKAKSERLNLPIVGYCAYFRLTNGFTKTLYMSVEEVDSHAKRYSQTYSSNNEYVRNSSKWTTDFDAMAKKTCLKLLLSRFAPLSVEMQKAVQYDQAVLRSENTPTYVDNEVIETSAEEVLDENKVIKAVLSCKTIEDAESVISMNDMTESERCKQALAKLKEKLNIKEDGATETK